MLHKKHNLLSKFLISAVTIYGCSGFASLALAEGENASVTAKIAVVPYETLSIGNESGCKKRALFAISDAVEWQRVWGVHTSGLSEQVRLPKVDFSRQTVLALLSGERSDGKALQVMQIVRSPQETVVYFTTAEEKLWLNVEANTVEPAEKAQPYTFIVMDKTSGPLRFVDALAASNCTKCAG
jgi:hypothetical protein